MKNVIAIEFERFTDEVGNPICAKNFDTGKVCRFLGSSGMCGKDDVCMFPIEQYPIPVYREGQVGFIQVHKRCPLWTV